MADLFPESSCPIYTHWRDVCPECAGELTETGRACGYDSHIQYRCWACGWAGRTGLLFGSPLLVHVDQLHAAEVDEA